MVTRPQKHEIIGGSLMIALFLGVYVLALIYWHPEPNFAPPTKAEIIERQADQIEILKSQVLAYQEQQTKWRNSKCLNDCQNY